MAHELDVLDHSYAPEEVWEYVEEAPLYMVSTTGNVMNARTQRCLRQSISTRGDYKVGLLIDGVQLTRLVKILVATTFMDHPDDIFDTVVHRDGDKSNNFVENLCYRPRWFSMKYTRQFTVPYPYRDVGPIMEVYSGEVYSTIHEAAVANVLLYKDILATMQNIVPTTVPTGQKFKIL